MKAMKYNFIFVAVLLLLVTSTVSCQKNLPDNLDYEPVKVISEWFEVNYLGDRIYSIAEPESSQGNVSYLVLGNDRALMFDTGCGENEVKGDYRIKYILDKITTLPVTLFQSHFHFDHNQNIHEFERIAFPNLPDLRERVSEDGLFHNDDLIVYQQTVDHLLSLLSEDYRLFGAHGDPEIEFGQLQKLDDFLACIEEGTCQFTE
jgi:hypothetical protein